MAESAIGSGAMMCAHCGRPAAVVVWIGGMAYHEECTHGPSYVKPGPYVEIPALPPGWAREVPAPQLTERDVLRIVRAELAKRGPLGGRGVV